MNCETKEKTKQNVNNHLENELVSIEGGGNRRNENRGGGCSFYDDDDE